MKRDSHSQMKVPFFLRSEGNLQKSKLSCKEENVAKVKNTTVFFCQECGYESVKWMGQCPGCKAWNSFVEEKISFGTKKMAGNTKSGHGVPSLYAELGKV